MKISIKNLFVMLAIVMSFVSVQAAWALDCNETVEGEVTYIGITDVCNDAITVDYDTTVCGVPADLGIVAKSDSEEGDKVIITAFETNDFKLIACKVSVIEGDSFTLRPERNKPTAYFTLTNESGALNCICTCSDTLQDCHCFCGDGPTGNDD